MKEYLPVIAIIISVISLSVSVIIAWRDRARVKTESYAYRHTETDEYCVVTIKVVNVGRRPITLRWLWGNYEGGHTQGTSIGKKGLVKLEEGEFYEERIGKYDGTMMYMGEHGEYSASLIDLFLEDTKGKKYKVKGSKESIQKVRTGGHPLGVRTHS